MKIPVLAGPQVDEGYRGRYGQHYVLKGSESEWQESGIACSCGCPESPFVAEISVLVEGKDWEEVDERVEISVRLR
jgi:hypothetical protein